MQGALPRPILFPYTTLFRSSAAKWIFCAAQRVPREASPSLPCLRQPKAARFPASLRCFRDRKSTRLNSSHTVISYAVFCLKKKKDKPDHELIFAANPHLFTH